MHHKNLNNGFTNKNLNNVKLAEQKLINICKHKIKIAIQQYNKSSNNNLYQFYTKNNKDYYYLCKAIPDSQKILYKNIQNQRNLLKLIFI